MPTLRRLLTLPFALGIIALVGCRADKLNETRDFTLSQEGLDRLIEMPAQKYEQTLSVTVSATEPVDVYIFLKSAGDLRDATAADRAKKALASKTGTQSDTLTAKIPANDAPNVLVLLGEKSKKSSVSVKLAN